MAVLPWGDMDVAVGRGTGRTPRSTEDFCHFSSLKSEAWPTQWYFKFKGKMWQ
jgi:hypothetical protein